MDKANGYHLKKDPPNKCTQRICQFKKLFAPGKTVEKANNIICTQTAFTMFWSLDLVVKILTGSSVEASLFCFDLGLFRRK